MQPPDPEPWAAQAARLPLAFSQVREDPAIDAALLPARRVFLIASGGDTAAWLVACGGIEELHLVDINSAQLALARCKLGLLLGASPEERCAWLGHSLLEPDERTRRLHGLGYPPDMFGPPELVAEVGPDHAGRYERLFVRLRSLLSDRRNEWEALLHLSDPVEQARRVAPETALGRDLDAAFASAMALPNLVCLFGREATNNPRLSFAEHFAERTRHALAQFTARENPFLAQLLLGQFVGGHRYLWLDASAPAAWPELRFTCAPAREALAAEPPDSLDLIHLSNILDWLSPEAAAETLASAWRALAPGGRVIIRQLNSTLEIPTAEPRFTWLPAEASALHARDRSFFYRALFLGRK